MSQEERRAQIIHYLNLVVPMVADLIVPKDPPPPEDDSDTETENWPPKVPEFENCVVAYHLPAVGAQLDITSPLGEGWKLSSLETSTERNCVYGFWLRIKPEPDNSKTDAPPPRVSDDGEDSALS